MTLMSHWAHLPLPRPVDVALQCTLTVIDFANIHGRRPLRLLRAQLPECRCLLVTVLFGCRVVLAKVLLEYLACNLKKGYESVSHCFSCVGQQVLGDLLVDSVHRVGSPFLRMRRHDLPECVLPILLDPGESRRTTRAIFPPPANLSSLQQQLRCLVTFRPEPWLLLLGLLQELVLNRRDRVLRTLLSNNLRSTTPDAVWCFNRWQHQPRISCTMLSPAESTHVSGLGFYSHVCLLILSVVLFTRLLLLACHRHGDGSLVRGSRAASSSPTAHSGRRVFFIIFLFFGASNLSLVV